MVVFLEHFRRIPRLMPVAYGMVIILLFAFMTDFRTFVPDFWTFVPGRAQAPEEEIGLSVPTLAPLSVDKGRGISNVMPPDVPPGDSSILYRALDWVAVFLPGPQFLKDTLADGVPLMSLIQKPVRIKEPAPAWRRAAESLGYFVAGIDVGDPLAVLSNQLPIMVTSELSGGIEVDDVEGDKAFDPIGWFWGTRRRDPNSPGLTTVPVALGQSPAVGFYSTHAYESYLSEMAARPVFLGDVTTWDNGHNIVRVAEELARTLFERHNISTVHSASHHNQEGQALSYKYSRLTAQRILKQYPSVRILADIHRDSTERGPETVAEIGGRKYARVMLVVAMGDPDAGLVQPNAAKALTFSNELFKIMEQKYPGLGRQVLPRKARYNQDLIPGAILIEIGGPENSLDEALNTAQAMADVLAEAIKTNKVP